MATEKKALWVVFRPEQKIDLDKMRQMYLDSYPHFAEMTSLYSKTWWVNQEKNEWGAMYIFNSQEAVDEYLASERWRKAVPEKYGCKPAVEMVLDLGPLLFKEAVTDGGDSWLTK